MKNANNEKSQMPIPAHRPTCLDFFSGSGLVAEGLKDFFQTIWANDICEKKARVFCANHPEEIFQLGSIHQIRGKNVPPAMLSWGSFPCQDLSLAGKMTGISSSRSGLVWEWLRVMDELPEKPPLAVAENVVGLVSGKKGANYRLLHKALVRRGYKVGAVILDASAWVPQSRKRVFVIAVDEKVPTCEFEASRPTWCHPKSVVRAASGLPNWIWWRLQKPFPRLNRLEDIIDFDAPCDDKEKREYLLNLIPDRHREKMITAHRCRTSVFPAYKRTRGGRQVLELRFDGIAGCLRTPQGGSSRQFLVIRKNGGFMTRLLTVKEAAALMGAPSHYRLPGAYNDGYRAMGDAVAVPVTRYLGEKLLYPLAGIIKERSF